MRRDREAELQIRRAKRHIGLIRASGDDLFCHPAVRLLQFASPKELHWRAAYSCSSKSKRERLPTWLGDDGYFGDLNAVPKKGTPDRFPNLRRAPIPQTFQE